MGAQVSRSVAGNWQPTPPNRATNTTTQLLLADPVTVTTNLGHPIGGHSGLGMSAFYFTLLLVLTGFVGGNIINYDVDGGLGYTDNFSYCASLAVGLGVQAINAAFIETIERDRRVHAGTMATAQGHRRGSVSAAQ
ncbi:hypothetical protein [Streptomyces sp. NPDC017435]|uniref:hypothetical protein n=1 Tax=Streptomyces sp. NPDC017435 TaxID=3364995 RepID=UPI0037B228BA